MSISIITVAKNAERTIGSSVASVASQDYPNLQHILIDGASTDQTVATAISSHNRISQVVSEPDLGIYDAMNKGAARASGDIIGFLNADDVYPNPFVISNVVAQFSADPTLDACYSNLVYVDNATASKIIRQWKSNPYYDGLFSLGWVPPHPTVFFKKSTFDMIGAFDIHYKFAADFDFLMRAFVRHKIRSKFVSETWVKMRVGGATNRSLSNIVKGNKEIYHSLKRNGIRFPFAVIFFRMMRRFPQFL